MPPQTPTATGGQERVRPWRGGRQGGQPGLRPTRAAQASSLPEDGGHASSLPPAPGRSRNWQAAEAEQPGAATFAPRSHASSAAGVSGSAACVCCGHGRLLGPCAPGSLSEPAGGRQVSERGGAGAQTCYPGEPPLPLPPPGCPAGNRVPGGCGLGVSAVRTGFRGWLGSGCPR